MKNKILAIISMVVSGLSFFVSRGFDTEGAFLYYAGFRFLGFIYFLLSLFFVFIAYIDDSIFVLKDENKNGKKN